MSDKVAIDSAARQVAADAVLGASAADLAGASTDPTADVAEYIAQVLAAYQQLRREIPTPNL
jgi:hypothetical protein